MADTTDTATATPETSGYDVKVEDAGPARKRLTITVKPEILDEKLEESMGTLASQAQLPGFRKGRAPMALLERRFGAQVREETRNQVVADGYAAALEQHEIKPLGDPEPVDKLDELEITQGKPLTFAVEVEVIPVFDLPDLTKLEVKKPMVEVSDDHVNTELERQRTQLGEVVAIADGFTEGDRLVGPGSATREGEDEPFFQHDNVDIIVPPDRDGGRGHVLGLLVDGLAAMIDGTSVGDELVIETVGPESHEMEDIRGKKLRIVVTIREAQRIIPCEVQRVLDEYGLESEEILRDQVKVALEQRRDEEQRGAMRDQVYDFLAANADFELPQRMTENHIGRMLDRQKYEMLYRGGMSMDEVEQRLAELRSETEEQSRKRLKLFFLLHRLADHFEIGVSDQEVNGRIAAIAMQRGMRPEQLRTEMTQSGAIQQIASQIREHKAADRVIDQATVTEVTLDDWNKSQGTPATGSKKKTSKKKTTKKKSS